MNEDECIEPAMHSIESLDGSREPVEHEHEWANGQRYKHTHRSGDVGHGHHGSRYVSA